jgi:hypothetical protein
MTPLLFAAALAIAPATPQPAQAIEGSGPPFSAPLRRLAPNQYIQAPPSLACAKFATRTVAPDGVRFFRRLDQLPWGVLEHAVWRTVGGCPVREIVFGGQTYYVASASPRIERLDPVAHRPPGNRFGF